MPTIAAARVLYPRALSSRSQSVAAVRQTEMKNGASTNHDETMTREKSSERLEMNAKKSNAGTTPMNQAAQARTS